VVVVREEEGKVTGESVFGDRGFDGCPMSMTMEVTGWDALELVERLSSLAKWRGMVKGKMR
jgi:hypothetical protein